MTPNEIVQNFGIEIILGAALSAIPLVFPSVGKWWRSLSSNQKAAGMPSAILLLTLLIEVVACQVEFAAIQCVGIPSMDAFLVTAGPLFAVVAQGAMTGYGVNQIFYYFVKYRKSTAKQ